MYGCHNSYVYIYMKLRYNILFAFKHNIVFIQPCFYECIPVKFSYDLCYISEHFLFSIYSVQYSTDEKFLDTEPSHVRRYIVKSCQKSHMNYVKFSCV